MIYDLILAVVDRFREINDIIVETDRHFNTYCHISVCRGNTADIICHLYFNLDHVLCETCHRNSYHIISSTFSYDELVDIDTFVGDILCKVFYD